jgi:hypothetical protein
MRGDIVLVLFDAFLVSLPATVPPDCIDLMRQAIGSNSEKYEYPLTFNVESLGRNWV